ncbi:MAG: DUF4097 family beta strand repeat-containing protein [Clostridia bacterium]
MAKPKNKGLSYILIFFGLIFAGVLTMAAILVLSPEKRIGNYTWIDENFNSKSLVSEDIAETPFDDIVINSNFYKVIVTERDAISPLSSFNLFLSSKLMGIVNYQTALTTYTFEIDANNDLVFNFTSLPSGGILFNKDSCVLNLVTYKSHEEWHTKKITIKTTSGSVVLGGGDVGNLLAQDLIVGSAEVETENGNITLSSKFNSTGAIILKTNSANININNSLTPTAFAVENLTGNVKMAENTTITASEISFDGNIAFYDMQNLVGTVQIRTTSGLIKVVKITGSVNCEDTMDLTNIVFGEVTGEFTVSSATLSDVTISKAGGPITINNESGLVNISNTSGFVYIRTTSGDITLSEVSSELDLQTVSGDINVNYKDALESCAVGNLTTEKGKIIVTKAVGIINATATGNGTINVGFSKTIGQSKLQSSSGKIETQISVVASNQFVLKTQSSGAVSVDLGSYISTQSEETIKAINGYEGSENQIYLLSASGAITCRTLA